MWMIAERRRSPARSVVVWARADRGQSEVWQRFAIEVLGSRNNDGGAQLDRKLESYCRSAHNGVLARHQSLVRRLCFWVARARQGSFELIEAACRRLAGGRNFTLDIVGEGNSSAEARALVMRHELTAVIRFRGWLQGDLLRQALADADVLVLPSWAEGLPNAMIEAMAARLAVVVSRVGAIPELISDRHSGLLVEPRNADSLACALAEIIDDDELRGRLACEAYAIAMRDFEVEAAVDRLLPEIEGTIVAGREHRLSGRVQ